jgi:putative flippase GtrA
MEEEKEHEKAIVTRVPFITSFIRSQMSSAIATAMDFAVFVFLTEIIKVYYVAAAAIAALAGAIISFFLGRNWAFSRRDGRLTHQAVKYIITSSTSLVLNTYGIYALTEYAGVQYIYSKIIISLLVGVFFNFFMYRYFVYK